MATKKKAAAANIVDAHVACASEMPAPAPAPEPVGVSNKYGVEVWDKWSPAQHKMFNGLYAYMYDNQRVFKHPKAPLLSDEQWRTVAWNAAWTAADLLRKD